jgi:hypothetical protein
MFSLVLSKLLSKLSPVAGLILLIFSLVLIVFCIYQGVVISHLRANLLKLSETKVTQVIQQSDKANTIAVAHEATKQVQQDQYSYTKSKADVIVKTETVYVHDCLDTNGLDLLNKYINSDGGK